MTMLGVHRPFGCRRSLVPLLASASFIVAVGLNAPASAQTVPAGTADAAGESSVEDIIVTAERRSQRLQEVPISITAVTGASLARAGLINITQLGQVATGLVVPANLTAGTSLTPFIRGIGSAAALPGIEASVALYIDGVYSGAKFLNLLDLANVERIEVLKVRRARSTGATQQAAPSTSSPNSPPTISREARASPTASIKKPSKGVIFPVPSPRV